MAGLDFAFHYKLSETSLSEHRSQSVRYHISHTDEVLTAINNDPWRAVLS